MAGAGAAEAGQATTEEPVVETTGAAGSPEDASGRDRVAFNVLSSWGGYLVIVVTGFVLPRLTDRYLGQTALGVWDFAWSTVSYFGLARIGVKSSINRYIAKYRSTADAEGLRRVASSVAAVNLVAAGLILGIAGLTAWAVPSLLRTDVGASVGEARWVVALLGANLAVQVAFDLYPGVIAGCHRWDLHNYIMAFFHVASVAAMSATLVLGGRLPHLALVILLTQVGTELTRMVVAHRVCPQLQVRLRHATWGQARKMLTFGAKSSLGAIASLLLFQGNNLLVARLLGPAALAVFARPLALLRVVETFANKFGFVLTPTASSLQHQGRHAEVRELFLDGARMGGGLVVPPILGLIILGEQVLLVWMGPRYSQGLVVSILAMGALVRLAQQSIISVLVGLNMHGRPALAGLGVAILGLGIGVANALYLGWGLVGFALALSVPQYLGAAYTALFACRRLEIPLRIYLRETLGVPLLAALPFALVLLLARVYLAPGSPALALAVGTAVGIVALAPPYWRYVIPTHFRDQLRRIASRKRLRSRSVIPA